MTEASHNPSSSHKPMGVAEVNTELLKPRSVRSPRGLEGSVVALGGYGLLAHSLFNLARSLAANKLSADPEVSLGVMSQLVALSPFFLLGPVLIFAPPGAIQAKGLAKQLTRWLVVFFALLFFLFIPLSFFQKHTLINKDTLQTKRLETVLQDRKRQILSAVQNAQSTSEIQQRLSSFPEIRRPNAIAQLPSPAIIREQLAASLDTAINLEINRHKQTQKQRLAGISKVVFSVSIGSLLAAGFFFALATYLFPRLRLNRHSLSRISKAMDKALSAPTSMMKKLYIAQLSRPHFARFFAILGLQRPRPSRRR
jgi:hypothetical protein